MPRPSRPWWRSSRGEWCAWVRGRQRRLGVRDPADRAAAEEALQRILAALPVTPPAPAALPADPVARARALVGELLLVLRGLPDLDSRERRETQLRCLLVDLSVLPAAAEPVPTPVPAPVVSAAG